MAIILFFLLFFFLAMPRSMWDLSSPTRDRTRDPCNESTVLTTGPPGKSQDGYNFKKGKDHVLVRICFLKKLNTELPSDLAIPLQYIYAKEMKIYTHAKTCT